ncbi:MAG: pyridoxal phosphate-dependent aminotransferase [Acidobacteria bacterium]|nr:pyridoxal phosphate-dependent aminotransferase [Acidobacteriota bacterium]
MPSNRLPADLSLNATTRALAVLKSRGIDVLDLTVSNPTRVGLEYPHDFLRALASPDALEYDPAALGAPRAREAVSRDFARRSHSIPPEHIALTASTSEAYSLLFKLLCDPGDGVLVPQPSYPLFEHLTVLESVEARPYRLEYHGTWRIDIDHLRAQVHSRTKALLIVSPNNPTGSRLHRDDLVAVAELCASRDMLLIGDEVFSDFPLDFAPHAASVLSGRDALVCSLGGLSKSVGLPQVKVGWIGFAGPADRLDALLRAYEVIADTYLSVSTPAQTALPDLLDRGAAVRTQIQHRVTGNLRALRAAVARTPSVTVLTVEGGWSAVLQVPAYRSEEALVLELLMEDHVLVHPGFFFDFEREAFLIVSLLAEPTQFARGIARLLARASQGSAAS